MERLKDMLDEESAGAWAGRSAMIQAHNKQTLLDFGISPLDI